MRLLRGVAFALTTVLIYLGVPLLGWGILHLEGFFSIPARTGYAVAVGIMGLLVGYQAVDAPEGIRGARGNDSKRSRRQSVVSAMMIAVLYVALFALPFADRRGWGVMVTSPVVRWAGLILTVLGLGLILWSGVALGKMYSKQVTIQANHRLVTEGLYGIVRHPRYLGVICLGIGFALLYRSWVALALAPPLVALLLMRIRDEEKLLRREFGEEWDQYCARSWRLIPFVY
jgi:protein-S-isoprenylcysteine O-methyltransferase Ste14